MKCLILCSRKSKKNIVILLSVIFAHSMVKVTVPVDNSR